ncbi:MAG: diaminopimelate dehydrogenase [Erysipelothrix sp.]|nr:diaminopimelate dehydrogenase [Erysipelothrix sp.]
MIKIGIVGYGNLGKGVELAIAKQPDMEVFGVFTKRNKENVQTQGSIVYHYDELLDYKEQIDVLVLCGSSERDLRLQSPELAKNFNLVDSFDMHAIILDHVNTVDKVALTNNTTAIVSAGWDPGIFSLQKTIMDAILTDGETLSFWGPGISQGHSDVAGRVEGVKMARNYSIPNEDNLKKFKKGKSIDAKNNHHKICYVVVEDDNERNRIEKEIKNIPHYFKGSSTTVKFISKEEMEKDHSNWPQGGRIIRTAKTSDDNNHIIEFTVNLDSNPEFTSSVMVAYARATYKMHQRKEYGAFTALDVRGQDLSNKSREQLIKEML